MTTKKKTPKKENPLVTIFTADGREGISDINYLEKHLAIPFELMLYKHYRVMMPLWAVKFVDVRKVEELETVRHGGMYNEYVEEAKKLGNGFYGIQLEFMVDTSG